MGGHGLHAGIRQRALQGGLAFRAPPHLHGFSLACGEQIAVAAGIDQGIAVVEHGMEKIEAALGIAITAKAADVVDLQCAYLEQRQRLDVDQARAARDRCGSGWRLLVVVVS